MRYCPGDHDRVIAAKNGIVLKIEMPRAKMREAFPYLKEHDQCELGKCRISGYVRYDGKKEEPSVEEKENMATRLFAKPLRQSLTADTPGISPALRGVLDRDR